MAVCCRIHGSLPDSRSIDRSICPATPGPPVFGLLLLCRWISGYTLPNTQDELTFNTHAKDRLAQTVSRGGDLWRGTPFFGNSLGTYIKESLLVRVPSYLREIKQGHLQVNLYFPRMRSVPFVPFRSQVTSAGELVVDIKDAYLHIFILPPYQG